MTGDRVGTTFGPYRLLELIGRGGMGEVFRAYDTVKDREVALKLLPPELATDTGYRERFQREARVAARLQEPHVIPIHDFGRIGDILYIDMRLVRGKDLRAVLRRPQRMDPEVAVDIVRQVGEALDAAHADGLVHRDVKPENILLLPSGFAYLADFGIAARTDEVRMTSAGTAIGSFSYMAPERFRDEPVSPATDVYSLGCVLYECLTGSAPFPRSSVPGLIQAHLNEAPRRPSDMRADLPPAMDRVIGRAMAKDPAQRFRNAAELSAAATEALRRGSPERRAGAAGPQHRAVAPTAAGASGVSRWADDPVPPRPKVVKTASARHPRHPDTSARTAVITVTAVLALVAAFALWHLLTSGNDDRAGSTTAPTSTSGSATTPGSTNSSTSSSSSPTTTAATSTTSISTNANGSTTVVTVTTTHSPSSTSTTDPTSDPPTTTSTTSTSSTTTSTSAPPSGPDSWPSVIPAGPGYDWQGWTAYSELRCGGSDRAVQVAASESSMITICERHGGGHYYLGMRPDQVERPNSLQLNDVRRTSSGWVARTGPGTTYSYVLSETSLRITHGASGDSTEEALSTSVSVD